MKKLKLLLPFCVLLVLFSCKKQSSSPTSATGTITATVDGTSQTFNVGATGHLDSSTGINDLSMIGLSGTAAGANSMIILVTSTGPIVAGTYAGSGSQGDLSYTMGSGLVYQYDDSAIISNATVIITSISSTTVKGTFSGSLVLVSGNGAATKTLTNGTFNLAIK
jgi:hypothetical protein